VRGPLALVLAGVTTAACELVFRPSGGTTIDADPDAPDAPIDADPTLPDADPTRPDARVDAEPPLPPDAACTPLNYTCFLDLGGQDGAPCLSPSPPANYCGLSAFDILDPYDLCGCPLPAIFVVPTAGNPTLAFVSFLGEPYRMTVNGGGCEMAGPGCSLAFKGSCSGSEALVFWTNVSLNNGSNDVQIFDPADSSCQQAPTWQFSVEF
jgi:hypothetical protein